MWDKCGRANSGVLTKKVVQVEVAIAPGLRYGSTFVYPAPASSLGMR